MSVLESPARAFHIPMSLAKHLIFALSLAAPTAVLADHIWLGAYRHDVTLAQTKFERGQDIKAGWMGERLDGLRRLGRPSPHMLVSKSLNGERLEPVLLP